MADTDVLPYDYGLYGKEVVGYVEAAENRANAANLNLDFTAALAAAHRFAAAGIAIHSMQSAPPNDPTALNAALRAAQEALLNPDGLPKRSWFKHTIYAPGEFTGYAAVVIPGVNEAIDASDTARAQAQLSALSQALNRSAAILDAASR
jgi:N-acetylated-alpha-linked acidic dipeptidase